LKQVFPRLSDVARRLLKQVSEVMFIMTTKNLQQKIRRTTLVLSIAFGFLVLSAVSASAQYYPQNNRQNRQDDRRDRQRERQDDINRNNNGGYNNNYSNGAQREGYRDGLAAGRDDRRDREQYNPQKHSDYRKATDGYDRRFGSKGQYKQTYRSAFLQGYARGYNRNNNNRRRGY